VKASVTVARPRAKSRVHATITDQAWKAMADTVLGQPTVELRKFCAQEMTRAVVACLSVTHGHEEALALLGAAVGRMQRQAGRRR
jgi:hypothetical protein